MRKAIVIAGAALLVSAGAALADGDAEKGERVFKKCKACHAVGEDAKNKVGPQLNGVVGREIASVEGYKYSKGMQEFAETHETWSEEQLSAYLAKPRDVVKGTKMAFAGLRKDDDLADVIAYLAQFNADGTTN